MKSQTAKQAPALAAAFRTIPRDAQCAVCKKTQRVTIIDPHHVLAAEVIRLYVREHKLNHAEAAALMWSLDNRLLLCRRDHDRHTLAKARVPWHLLPPEAIAFAERLGLLWRLEAVYPKMRMR